MGEDDYRTPTLEALIRECTRVDTQAVVNGLYEEGDGAFPGSRGLFELAIAEKNDERIEEYRRLGKNFESGYLALVRGDTGRAIHFLRKSRSAGSPSFIELMELGRALSIGECMEEARIVLKEAERLSGTDREVLVLVAAVNMELGRFEEAHDVLAKLLRIHTENAEVSFILGRALLGMRKNEAALSLFRGTVQLDPRFHEAFFEVGRLLVRGGNSEGAFRLLSRACALAPDEIRYNRELAELVLGSELNEEAGLAA